MKNPYVQGLAIMRKCFPVLLSVFFCSFGLRNSLLSQQSSSDSTRKVIRKTVPSYPDIAKKMNLAGTVKVLAVVAPDGTVKKVEPVGGSPLLVQAAEDAVSKWKYAPASSESREPVELRFTP
jgi:TonB family protein